MNRLNPNAIDEFTAAMWVVEPDAALVDKVSCPLADPAVDAFPPIIEHGRRGRGWRPRLASGSVTHRMTQ